LREHEEIDIRIFGSAMERETEQNTTDPNYSGTTPAVKRPGGVTVEARIMYRDVIPTFDGPPITIEEPLGEGYDSASASLDRAPTRQDRCGRTITAQFDEASCNWKWPESNAPCLPDDNRSVATAYRGSSAHHNEALFIPQPARSSIIARQKLDAPKVAANRKAVLNDTATTSIAVFDNGFSPALLSMLNSLGLKADRLPADFSPELASRYRVLVIPTGGLSGYAQSDLMRERLAQYARNGGVIVAFAQEYGAEFNLLPGQQLQGYGYDEDINCQTDSSRVATFAPMLLSQSRELVSLNVDGFFTRWPTDAQVLLNRVANGMPDMLAYPVGPGWVVATTAYPDMARYQGQSTNDEAKLVRDLMVWALDPAFAMDRFGPHRYSHDSAHCDQYHHSHRRQPGLRHLRSVGQLAVQLQSDVGYPCAKPDEGLHDQPADHQVA
jgi:hypothetical protein